MRQSDSSEGTRVGWKTRKTRSLLRGPRAHVITEEKSMRISREEQKKKKRKRTEVGIALTLKVPCCLHQLNPANPLPQLPMLPSMPA